MKTYFHSRNSEFISVLLFLALISTSGCSFKTVLHPYPQQFQENPEDYPDRLVLQKTGNFEYLPHNSDQKIDLNYSEGTLFIDDGWSPILEKQDRFINPITSEEFEIASKAFYDSDEKEDIFEVLVTKKDSANVHITITGNSDSALIIDSKNDSLMIQMLNMWAPSVQKTKGDDGNEWHHYPLGGMWQLTDEKGNKFKIVQGSPVKKQLGSPTHYGESFTFLFESPVSESLKEELINIFIGYWNLTNIQFYFEECDFEEPSSDACPGSIIIK